MTRRGTRSRLPDDDRGASAVEYALIITCVALLIVGALIAFGGSVAGLYDVDF